MIISNYLVPVIILALLIYAVYKRLETYNIFVKGARDAFDLVLSIFPFIATIMIMVALMRVSGLTDVLVSILAPLFNVLGIPTEVSELVLLRPFTGSGSYAILNGIFETYGPDCYISRCASVMMSTSETIFYVASVYFSQTSVKKLSYAIPLALVCSLFGTIVACLICRFI
ncbi:MAG: spore maturation protein [Clostridia bacterium]|nr:spore maturation protein [Clostridia bacterium]MDD4686218.1 spore maturation protein [Clostridia bacterium]